MCCDVTLGCCVIYESLLNRHKENFSDTGATADNSVDNDVVCANITVPTAPVNSVRVPVNAQQTAISGHPDAHNLPGVPPAPALSGVPLSAGVNGGGDDDSFPSSATIMWIWTFTDGTCLLYTKIKRGLL